MTPITLVASGMLHAKRTVLALLAIGLCVGWGGVALAQPGEPPPPGLLVKVQQSGRILDGQGSQLVWLEDVAVESLETYTSSAGRTHLRFGLVVEGTSYPAIMYAFDWGEADRARLAQERVSLIGLWDEYRGEPSFVAKWVEPSDTSWPGPDAAVEDVPDRPVESSRPLLRIADARTADVEKFVSRSLRMHARFTFTVPGDPTSYDGIVFEGDWNTDVLDALRSGTAHLIGYWHTEGDVPFFVLQRID